MKRHSIFSGAVFALALLVASCASVDPRTAALTYYDTQAVYKLPSDAGAAVQTLSGPGRRAVAVRVNPNAIELSRVDLPDAATVLQDETSGALSALGFVRVVPAEDDVVSFLEGDCKGAVPDDLPDFAVFCNSVRLASVREDSTTEPGAPAPNPTRLVTVKTQFALYDNLEGRVRFRQTISKEAAGVNIEDGPSCAEKLLVEAARDYVGQIGDEIGPVGTVLRTTGNGRYAYVSLGRDSGLVVGGRVRVYRVENDSPLASDDDDDDDEDEDQPVAKVAKKPVVKKKPVAKAVEKPVAKAAEKPVAKAPEKPVAKAAEEPVAKVTEKPVAKAAEKPVAKAAEKPVAKAAEEPVAKAAEEPVAKVAEKPVAKTAEKPVAKAAEKPVAKVAEKPVAKAAEKPVAKAAEKPVAKAAEKPAATTGKAPNSAAKPAKKKPAVSVPTPEPVVQVSEPEMEETPAEEIVPILAEPPESVVRAEPDAENALFGDEDEEPESEAEEPAAEVDDDDLFGDEDEEPESEAEEPAAEEDDDDLFGDEGEEPESEAEEPAAEEDDDDLFGDEAEEPAAEEDDDLFGDEAEEPAAEEDDDLFGDEGEEPESEAEEPAAEEDDDDLFGDEDEEPESEAEEDDDDLFGDEDEEEEEDDWDVLVPQPGSPVAAVRVRLVAMADKTPAGKGAAKKPSVAKSARAGSAASDRVRLESVAEARVVSSAPLESNRAWVEVENYNELNPCIRRGMPVRIVPVPVKTDVFSRLGRTLGL